MSQLVFDRQTIGSLLVQRAWERGYAPATMTYRMGIHWSLWTRDIDRSLSVQAIVLLSQGLAMSHNDIRAMTMTHALDAAGVPTQRNGFQKWLTPVGVYHRKRLRFGQMFCPCCLHEGRNYLRLAWRLASNWICCEHQVFLHDGCPQCGAPFAPFRQDALILARCDRCMAPLDTHPQPATKQECALQNRLCMLWHQALQGDGTRLAAFHESLVTATKQNLKFRASGESWTFWRASERRELIVSVGLDTLSRPHWNPELKASTTTARLSRVQRRKRRALPSDRAARAHALIQLAKRVKFARRPKAKFAKTA